MAYITYTKEQSKEEIKKLVEQFDNDFGGKKNPDFKEAHLEEKYIKPFFSYLNWNIHNENIQKGREEFRVQTSHRVKKTVKEPDYELWIPDKDTNVMRRCLFMEAKSPKYDLKKEVNYIRQAYQYAHSTLSLADHSRNRTRLSLLTDFEEFRLFDCLEPYPLTKNDANIFNKYVIKDFDLNYQDYINKFDLIWDTFERNNVYNGSLDKYKVDNDELEKNRKAPDLRFLDDLKKWRLDFAKSMYKSNKSVTDELLTSASQLLINRIIFTKMLTDRDIEKDYLTLILETLNKDKKESVSIYESCKVVFNELDKKYNGDIFKERKEFDCVKIENKIFKEVLISLKPEYSVYTLAAMPVEIIGRVYEKFLGEVIVHKGKGLSSVLKPEFIKSKGVYYTPRYIVDYIVENTVGVKLKECKKPSDVSSIKIIDPACGSGSFLIGAYDYLLEWHLDYYKKEIDKMILKGKDEIYINKSFKDNIKYYKLDENKYLIHLTSKLKKQILLNNIYGVDIDKNAVEITKFSLSMKALENTSKDELEEDITLFEQKLLPNMENNIKCGNSIIDDDYFYKYQNDLFDDVKHKKINSFNWEEEYKNIFEQGKFDVVIGNPPWVSLSGKFKNNILSDEEQNYLIEKYNGNTYMPNLYEYFIWKGIEITKENGLFSFIVPDRLGFNLQFIMLRKYIIDNLSIINLVYKAPFPNVSADTLMFVFNKKININNIMNVSEYGYDNQKIKQESYLINKNFDFSYEKEKDVSVLLNLIDKINSKQLITCFDISGGFGGLSKLITDKRINDSQIEVIKGESIGKYTIKKTLYFEFKKDNITGRTTDPNKLGAVPKILIRKTGYPLYVAYDEKGIYPEQSLYFLYNNKTDLSDYFYIGILGSNVFNFYYWNKLVTNKNTTPQLKKIHLDIFPIPIIDTENKKELYLNITNITKSIIDLLSDNMNHNDELRKFERFLNKYVYDLYELKDIDIKELLKYI